MRTAIFFLSVIALIGSGIWLYLHKEDDSFDIALLVGDSEEMAKIRAESPLLGRWNYNEFAKNDDELYRVSGEVKYNADGTFKSNLTWSYYAGDDVKEAAEYLDTRTKTEIQGKWLLPSKDQHDFVWQEKILSCEERYVKTNEELKIMVCINQRGMRTKYDYANLDGYEIRTFTKDSIIVAEATELEFARGYLVLTRIE